MTIFVHRLVSLISSQVMLFHPFILYLMFYPTKIVLVLIKKNCLAVNAHTEPKTFLKDSKHDCWQKSMKAELNALILNKTWSIVDFPSGKSPIGCK